MRSALPCLALAAALLAAAPAAPAADPSSQAEETDRAELQERVLGAQDALIAALERHAAALDAYRHMRHRRNEAGPAKAAILEELEEAERAVPEAHRELQQLYEEARRAGITRGWLRQAREEFHESAPAAANVEP